MHILAALLLLTSTFVSAYEWTEKKVFTIADFATAQGRHISAMRVGYEHWGTLNEQRNNVILITHYFSGNSHAAGRYSADDKATGYWDAIIGPGKAIDTTRFFVISIDTPVNLAVHDAQVITTGPATINPATQKPYALSFPVLQVIDFVNVQKAVLESFGITQIYAVAGASGGAIQALQWATSYPQWVSRVIAVTGPGFYLPAYSVAELGLWMQPILSDPLWQNGNYYNGKPPRQGVSQALRHITHSALSFSFEQQFAQKPADENQLPALTLQHDFAVNRFLVQRGIDRGALVDANHLLYMARAYQLFNVGDKWKQAKAEFLFLPSTGDRLFPPSLSHEAAAQLQSQGLKATVVEFDGGMGHLDGVVKIELVAKVIAEFL